MSVTKAAIPLTTTFEPSYACRSYWTYVIPSDASATSVPLARTTTTIYDFWQPVSGINTSLPIWAKTCFPSGASMLGGNEKILSGSLYSTFEGNSAFSPGYFCPSRYTTAYSTTGNQATTTVSCCYSSFDYNYAVGLCEGSFPSSISVHHLIPEGSSWRTLVDTVGPAKAFANAVVLQYVGSQRAAFTATAATTSSIRRTFSSTPKAKGKTVGLSTSTQAVVGACVAFVVLVALALTFIFWRRNRRATVASVLPADGAEQTGWAKSELDASAINGVSRGKEEATEIDSRQLTLHDTHHEIGGDPVILSSHPNNPPSSEIHSIPIHSPQQVLDKSVPTGSNRQNLTDSIGQEEFSPREKELRRLELEEERIRQRKFELQGPQA
ncbi:hypothetical protein EJ08DRAFT_248637 [Tothia fuscella]|uniref:Uncharacterized protein n=1 Tax=Tothia fuscella TaxID=1048955 RepID=A0A9P4NQP6_9PEZI|nr:hypothetical protein EJ08DRAFT_248637 [Tothia fuscella]